MSLSGRKKIRNITGPSKPRVVTKIRRSREAAYTSDWDAISRRVKELANWTCRKCGTREGPFESDHIIPVSKGGVTALWNLQCLCWLCHSKRPGHKHLYKQRVLNRSQGKRR